jgi:hypothetical protein
MTKNDLKDVQNEMKDLKTELQTEIKDFRVRPSDQTLFFPVSTQPSKLTI